MNNNNNNATHAFTPSHTVVTPYIQQHEHEHAHDYDECSELMPRSLPLPMQQLRVQAVHPQESKNAETISNHQVQEQSISISMEGVDIHTDINSILNLENDNDHANTNVNRNANTNSQTQQMYQENQQLRTILRDLGCASLIPPSVSQHHDDESTSTHSSQLSQSFFQNLQLQRKNEHPHANMNMPTIPSHIPMTTTMATTSMMAMAAQPDHDGQSHQIITELNIEREQLHQICQLKTDALSQIQTELHSVYLQRDAMSHENSRLNSEVVMLRQRIQEEQDRSDVLQNEIRALHIAKNELWKDLNRGMEEKSGLESECGRVRRELNSLKQNIHLKTEENGQLMANLKQLENDVQRRMMQVAALEGEQDEVCMELCVVKKSLEQMETEKSRLSQDLNCSKMNSNLNSQKTLEIQQFAAKSHNDAVAYQSMVVELEGDRDSIQIMLDEERARMQGLEEALYNSKACESAASEQIRILIREKAQVVTKLNEANARLGCSSIERRPPDSATRKRADSILKQTKLFFLDGTPKKKDAPSSSQAKYKRTPLKESGRFSLQEKQKAVELSLRELELASPLPDSMNMIGLSHHQNNATNINAEYASSLLTGKENECPGNENDSAADISFSLLGPLTMHDIKSPPSTKMSLKNECATHSLLDFLSQDDASTLI
jgi:hypothetical protein